MSKSSRLYLEFKGPKVQTRFPGTDEPGGKRAQVLSWESPRLSTEIPYEGRPAGSDRAICRTVNAIVQVNLLNKDVLGLDSSTFKDDFLTAPFINIGLYGESSGIIGAIGPIYQGQLEIYNLSNINTANLKLFSSNGGLGAQVFRSYSNLMQNIFVRVSISRGYTSPNYEVVEPLINLPLNVAFSCSGVLMAGDPR